MSPNGSKADITICLIKEPLGFHRAWAAEIDASPHTEMEHEDCSIFAYRHVNERGRESAVNYNSREKL
jgi:hypothetical protein